jgi:hypothetical protein
MQSIIWRQVLICAAATAISAPILADTRDHFIPNWLVPPFLLARGVARSCFHINIF